MMAHLVSNAAFACGPVPHVCTQFNLATRRIRIPGVDVIAYPLFEVRAHVVWCFACLWHQLCVPCLVHALTVVLVFAATRAGRSWTGVTPLTMYSAWSRLHSVARKWPVLWSTPCTATRRQRSVARTQLVVSLTAL